jgi:hypothetical protein
MNCLIHETPKVGWLAYAEDPARVFGIIEPREKAK